MLIARWQIDARSSGAKTSNGRTEQAAPIRYPDDRTSVSDLIRAASAGVAGL